MRILTVRQPWAWAIIHGQKDVENRVRNIAGAYRGPVAIHGGLSLDADAFADPTLHDAWLKLRDADLLAGGWSDEHMGAIIGVVDLVDVHHGPFSERWDSDLERNTQCSAWAMPDHFHLVLANPRPLAEPIPYKGALGLRNLAVQDPITTARILAQIGA